MKSRGLLTIAVILTVAVAAVGWAWWTKYTSMDQAMAYYGAENAKRIRFAETVEIWEIGLPDEASDTTTIEIDGKPWPRAEVRDASEWEGMVHARFYLTQDASYLWNGNVGFTPGTESWQAIMVFRDGTGETKIAFDFESEQLKLLPDGESVSFHPSGDGLRIVLVRD